MAQLGCRTFLIVVLLLLASVATASAACAWVLWAATTGSEAAKTTATVWDVIQALDSRQACDDIVQAKIKRQNADNVVSDNIITFKTETRVTVIRFLCLPDTVDPRGPKGN